MTVSNFNSSNRAYHTKTSSAANFESSPDWSSRFWATCRGATSGSQSIVNQIKEWMVGVAGSTIYDPKSTYWNHLCTFYRCALWWNSSAIPDTDDISAAKITLRTNTAASFAQGVSLVAYTGDATTALSNYGTYGSTVLGTGTIPAAGVTNFDITLNAAGIAAISKTGTTVFGLRIDADLNDAPANTTGRYGNIVTASAVLVVTHAAGGGANVIERNASSATAFSVAASSYARLKNRNAPASTGFSVAAGYLRTRASGATAELGFSAASEIGRLVQRNAAAAIGLAVETTEVARQRIRDAAAAIAMSVASGVSGIWARAASADLSLSAASAVSGIWARAAEATVAFTSVSGVVMIWARSASAAFGVVTDAIGWRIFSALGDHSAEISFGATAMRTVRNTAPPHARRDIASAVSATRESDSSASARRTDDGATSPTFDRR